MNLFYLFFEDSIMNPEIREEYLSKLRHILLNLNLLRITFKKKNLLALLKLVIRLILNF